MHLTISQMNRLMFSVILISIVVLIWANETTVDITMTLTSLGCPAGQTNCEGYTAGHATDERCWENQC